MDVGDAETVAVVQETLPMHCMCMLDRTESSLRARLSHMCGVGSVRRLCAFRALSHGVLSESGRAGARASAVGLKSGL